MAYARDEPPRACCTCCRSCGAERRIGREGEGGGAREGGREGGRETSTYGARSAAPPSLAPSTFPGAGAPLLQVVSSDAPRRGIIGASHAAAATTRCKLATYCRVNLLVSASPGFAQFAFVQEPCFLGDKLWGHSPARPSQPMPDTQ